MNPLSPATPLEALLAAQHAMPTALIGRQVELAEIDRLLADPACRLLTILGPGGVGKTRLALAAARRQLGSFGDGVVWVDLQAVQRDGDVATAVAGALLLARNDDPHRQLLRFLADTSLLLVLDNFEHLVDGAGIVGEFLGQGSGLKVLVTSRLALHLQEEWLYPLAGLPYPPADAEALSWPEAKSWAAVQLLIERVRRVRPDFSPQDEQRDLLRICRQVEGMPLALELAAAWTRSLDCAAIAAEIERNLAFLTSTLRNVPDRHRSMQAVFNHSWSLLSPHEQAVFARLAVFRGGFGRAAAEAVAGATLPVLAALVDHSLLQRQEGGRYHIHELLRQHAESRLVQSTAGLDAVRARHAAYYLDFLAQRTAAILGSGQQAAAAGIGAEMDNIRSAWQWTVAQGRIAALGRAVEALAMAGQIQGRYAEAAAMFRAALAATRAGDEEAAPARLLLLSELGWMAIRLGRFAEAAQVFGACRALYTALDLAPLPGQGTDPLLGLGTLAAIDGDYPAAEELAQAAVQRALSTNQTHNLQTANYLLASIASAQGDYEAAQAYAQAAYTACEQTGDRWFMAYCHHEWGRAARALGDLATARRHFEAGYAIREAFSDPEGMALVNLGDIALYRQEGEAAHEYFARAAALYRRSGDQGGMAAAYNGLAKAAADKGDLVQAGEAFGRALAIAAGIGFAPRLLAILADAGQFLVQRGQAEPGLALLALVLDQTAAGQETKEQVRRQLRHYRATLSPALFAATSPIPDLQAAVALAQSALAAAPSLPPAQPPPPAPALVEPLSEREQEVLALLAQGLTNQEIAQRLTVVVGTVKAHNNRIFAKLGVKNRGQAVARARQLDLL